MTRGLILFAHGARDARWGQPFARLLDCVRALRPTVECRLAYLEQMQPDLGHAADELVALECTEITVVPVFLGEGGHVREDLPVLVRQIRERYPNVSVTCKSAAGEDSLVLDALAAFCVSEIANEIPEDSVSPRLDII